MNGSPMVVIGGRAPQRRWGAGSLQELDHVPIVASVVKRAATATSADVDRRGGRRRVRRGAHAAPRPDVRRHPARRVRARVASTCPVGRRRRAAGRDPDPDAIAGGRRRSSPRRERPVLLAGGDVYWAHAEARAASRSRKRRGVPVFVNGMGRGHDPGRPRARVLARAVGRAEGSRPRARRGNAARLPARLRPLRRRAGRAPVRRAERGRARTPTSRRRPRAISPRRSPRWPTSARRPAGPRRLDREAPRRRERRSAPTRQPTLARRHARRSSRRASTASCGRGSIATRS